MRGWRFSISRSARVPHFLTPMMRHCGKHKKKRGQRLIKVSLQSRGRGRKRVASDYIIAATTILIAKQYSLEAVSDSFSESGCDGERQLVDYLSAVLDLLILLSCCQRWLWQPANKQKSLNNCTLPKKPQTRAFLRHHHWNANTHLNWVHSWIIQNMKC